MKDADTEMFLIVLSFDDLVYMYTVNRSGVVHHRRPKDGKMISQRYTMEFLLDGWNESGLLIHIDDELIPYYEEIMRKFYERNTKK